MGYFWIIIYKPKRKEVILSSVWGRLNYWYEFENDIYPAIILEAFPVEGKLKWSKSLKKDDQQEFLRLQNDGFHFNEDKRLYVAKMEEEYVRNTQLYRTLFHEFGHYVHYLNIVVRPELDNEEFEEWEKRSNYYFNITSAEKEVFAHNYADKLQAKLSREGIIPFGKKGE